MSLPSSAHLSTRTNYSRQPLARVAQQRRGSLCRVSGREDPLSGREKSAGALSHHCGKCRRAVNSRLVSQSALGLYASIGRLPWTRADLGWHAWGKFSSLVCVFLMSLVSILSLSSSIFPFTCTLSHSTATVTSTSTSTSTSTRPSARRSRSTLPTSSLWRWTRQRRLSSHLASTARSS